ncbi:ATP-binding protein [Sphingomonas solaris]|uniref:ATP-binding protein n=1 Tax=Alterirhizorhabdus solaris TaxID=2529389 RepID=A0A558QZW3_9SPHN|nr:ATP-binding protein [Sphingomonas solaris]TVV72681.1 ATP-binding protein [Sphingomonas solaris]
MLDPAPMDGNDPDTIHVAADDHAVALATGFARGFARRHRLDEDAAARLAIVIEELVTNLVEHGGAPGCPIDLALVRMAGVVDITILDSGTHFDPRDAVTSTLPPARGGGVGISLVLAWATVTDYCQANGRNRLMLRLPA